MGRYFRPGFLPEALEALRRGVFTVIAGGTDYYPARVGRPTDEDILDISAIGDLRGIEERGDHVRIGALTTWTDVVEAGLPPWFDGLVRAAREVGGIQVQNAGTIGGNLCNASPAADGVPPLLTLDASVELASLEGTVTMPLADFILGNRRTALSPGQLMAAVIVPQPRRPAFGHFNKLGARRYLVISIVMVAAVVEVEESGRVAAARVAVGACSAVARRLGTLEEALVGQPFDEFIGKAVTAEHVAVLDPIDDVRGSAAYRFDAGATLVRRTLDELGGIAAGSRA